MFETREKLYKLEMACRELTDKKAVYVRYAVERYIMTGRASIEFEKAFLQFPDESFSKLIIYCLERDLSDVGIIKSVSKIICKENRSAKEGMKI